MNGKNPKSIDEQNSNNLLEATDGLSDTSVFAEQ